jgi:hypothetical protein
MLFANESDGQPAAILMRTLHEHSAAAENGIDTV